MGSPSSRLKTAEKYRPWVDAGLEYVLAPGHAEEAMQAQQAQPAAQPSQPVQQQAVQQPVRQQAQQAPAQQRQVPAAPPQQPNSHPQQPPRQPSQSMQKQPVAQSAGQPVAFPHPWDGFLARVKAKAPKVICTYMELGLDLGGQPDPRRADVLRNTLTHHLKWPPGTAAFWPVAALSNGALQPDPTMFWKGWELWHSPYIVCFGDEALRVIAPQSEQGATTCLLEHVTIHVVPPLSKLMTLLPHEQQIAMEQLMTIRF